MAGTYYAGTSEVVSQAEQADVAIVTIASTGVVTITADVSSTLSQSVGAASSDTFTLNSDGTITTASSGGTVDRHCHFRQQVCADEYPTLKLPDPANRTAIVSGTSRASDPCRIGGEGQAVFCNLSFRPYPGFFVPSNVGINPAGALFRRTQPALLRFLRFVVEMTARVGRRLRVINPWSFLLEDDVSPRNFLMFCPAPADNQT